MQRYLFCKLEFLEQNVNFITLSDLAVSSSFYHAAGPARRWNPVWTMFTQSFISSGSIKFVPSLFVNKALRVPREADNLTERYAKYHPRVHDQENRVIISPQIF